MIRPPGISGIIWNQLCKNCRKSSKPACPSPPWSWCCRASTAIANFRRWPPIPPAKRNVVPQSAAASRPRSISSGSRRLRRCKDVKWSQLGGSHQRRKLSQQDRNLRRGRGAQRRRHRQDAGVRARQQAVGHDGRRAPQHGRAGVPQGRHRARHARLQRDRAQRERAIDHRAAGRDLARHPERAASALCGPGDAVDRYFQRRRIDLGQRPRHGPSGRRAAQVDQVDARDAGGRFAANGVGDRECGPVRSRGRRLRPVRRHRRGRTRYRRQPGLPDRAARCWTTRSFRRCSPARSRRTAISA